MQPSLITPALRQARFPRAALDASALICLCEVFGTRELLCGRQSAA